ncbi:10645_t:CDS:2 [Entrophospora sp. SA101]|nr:10645_t:CDS:2 [Entrophospora sp. SA101]
MDTKSISSDNIISSQVISPTSTTQNPFHNITLNVTLNVAHAVSNVPLNLARYTDDLITDANTNTNEQDSSDIDYYLGCMLAISQGLVWLNSNLGCVPPVLKKLSIRDWNH